MEALKDQYPLFSVLIANYNNGCYLKDAINSVMSQTYTNWEVVIVDDCSSDNSREVYKELETDSRIHVFFNGMNQGVGYTKRRCVELAQGEICGFIDPDDLLAEIDAIEVMVQTHQKYPNASLVYSGFYKTDEKLAIKYESNGLDLDSVSALESCSWPFKPFASFLKAKYEETSGIDPWMKRAVDYDMYYKLEEVGDIIHINRLLYYYRQNSHSISLNDNEYKSRVWHSYTCVSAMKRRGLTDEKLMLFPIEDALRKEYIKGIRQVKSTFTYRVGDAILKPFKMVRHVFELFQKD